MADQPQTPGGGIVEKLPTAQLMDEFRNLMDALGERAVSAVTGRVEEMTGRLTDAGKGAAQKATGEALKTGGKPGRVLSLVGTGVSGAGRVAAGAAKGAANTAKQAIGGGGEDGKRSETDVTNIVEEIDVGVPVDVAYNQWTQFGEFPSFMKKVEEVGQESDEKLRWRAQVLWSHRTWESTIIEQVPDERIVWRSEGEKGSVDGAVTFHELAPNLTRILLVLEYHPKGFFERTGNLWRAQGRRARLELKHFKRHVMAHTILHPEEIEGWRGEIREGEVIRDHESAQREAQSQQRQARPEEEPGSEEQEEEQEEQGSTEQFQRSQGRQASGRRAESRERADGGNRPARKRRPGPDEDQRHRRPARRAESPNDQ